eukprot:CAMPEP_0196158814 /NCGR_PEP_ID=MMETSP0910-20130528/45998_1 /TAXON_ID=49265 /ORGANISM="Thalassiosira rotula, Strain GSO102" /LENGTH=132 /DNA_ID=CAMNT_0041423725 /DNA_START=104 /DNA_END=502 /DNA_ORIENTATION=+
MKSAIIATIIGSAAAFAPAPVAKTTTSLAAFEDELGAQPPLGFFDPFGMLSGDVTQERFDRLRYVEIKHGRICQLAFLGQIETLLGHISREHAEGIEENGRAAMMGILGLMVHEEIVPLGYDADLPIIGHLV